MNSSMKTTGRFALVLGALTAAFLLLLLLAPPAAAQHSGTGMVLPGGSGGISSATADANYLRLDGTNDPMTGALTIPAGAVGTPSLNLTGDTTTGLYRVGASQLGFAAGGVNAGTFTTAGLLLPAGSAAAPSLNVGPTATAGCWADASYMYCGLGGSYRVAWSATTVYTGPGITLAAGGNIGTNSGLISMQSGGLIFSTASQYPRVRSDYADTTATYAVTGGLQLYSAMDAASESAVAIGTSAASTNIDTYLLRVGADVDSATAMVSKFDFMGDGVMLAGLGSAARPTYSFIGDPDTGMYNSAADAVGFTAGGTLRATIDATGLVPGSDNAFNLGSSTLSWGDIFTKYVSDQAGTNRLRLEEAGATTLTATTTLTAGVDSAFLLNVSTDFAATDKVLVVSDNTAGASAALLNLYGNGNVEATSYGWTSAGTTRMTFASGPAIRFDVNATEVANIAAGGLTVVSGSFSVTTGGITISTAGSTLSTNIIQQSPSGSTTDMRISSSSVAGNELKVYTAANDASEVAVVLGSSDTTASGTILTQWCLSASGADTANRTVVAELFDTGNFQMDGDLTVDGNDFTLGTVASINNAGNMQLDGILQADSGVKIGTTGTTITESNSVSTGSVDFASISADTCGEKTLTVTGADVNTPVACSWPAALEANLIGMCYVSAADTVTFRLCNMTAVAIDPAAATFGARTIK